MLSRWWARLRAQRLVLACGLVASLPVIASAVHAVVTGWHPVGDDALIAVRALDTLTPNAQLLGMPSYGASTVGQVQTNHMGPLLFWLLALPARLPFPSALELTIGVVDVACIVGVVALARRRGGLPLMLAVTIAIPLMCASLPADALSDVFNPAAPLLPFLLLLFCSWSVACGEFRLLPLAVVIASFAIQCHFTYLAPSVGALVVAGVGLVLSGRRPPRRWLLATAGVLLVCWSAPLLDQAIHRPGNLVRLVQARTADEPSFGPAAGARAVARAVGVPPWWLGPDLSPLERVVDVSRGPGPLAVVTALLVLGGLVAVAIAGLRRRRRDVAWAACIALAVCAGLAFTAASTPRAAGLAAGYALWWASPAGMFVWVALAWGATELLWARRAELPRLRRPAAAAAFAAAVVCAIVVTATGTRPTQASAAMKAAGTRLDEDLPPDGRVAVDAHSSKLRALLALDFLAGTAYELRRSGRDVSVPVYVKALGSEYGKRGRPRTRVLVLTDRRAPTNSRVIERATVPALGGYTTVTIVETPVPR